MVEQERQGDIPLRGADHRHRGGGGDDGDRGESRHRCWEPIPLAITDVKTDLFGDNLQRK